MAVRAWSGKMAGRIVPNDRPMRVYRNGEKLSLTAAEMQPGDLGPTQQTDDDGVTILYPITKVEIFEHAMT